MLITAMSALIEVFIVQFVIRNALSVKINRIAYTVFLFSLFLLFTLPFLILPESSIKDVILIVSMFFSLLSPLFIFRDIRKSHSFYIAALTLGLISTIAASLVWIIYVTDIELVDSGIIDLILHSAI